MPGAKVVWEKGFLGVVADQEWDAIQAVQKLKVEWSNATPPFPDAAALYDHIRKSPVRKREESKPVGNADEAFRTAARVVEAEYEWPFQSHACMGPACAIVEIKNGEVTCWTGSQKPHFVRDGIADVLGISVEKVRSIWTVGPGSYGRSDADDAAMDAAVMARVVGKPVRVQYMREQGTGWDPKGPASIHRAAPAPAVPAGPMASRACRNTPAQPESAARPQMTCNRRRLRCADSRHLPRSAASQVRPRTTLG